MCKERSNFKTGLKQTKEGLFFQVPLHQQQPCDWSSCQTFASMAPVIVCQNCITCDASTVMWQTWIASETTISSSICASPLFWGFDVITLLYMLNTVSFHSVDSWWGKKMWYIHSTSLSLVLGLWTACGMHQSAIWRGGCLVVASNMRTLWDGRYCRSSLVLPCFCRLTVSCFCPVSFFHSVLHAVGPCLWSQDCCVLCCNVHC